MLERDRAGQVELKRLLSQHDIRATLVSEHRALLGALSKEVIDAVLVELDDEVVENVRKLAMATHAPILVVSSAKTHEDDRIGGLDAGATDYICRPVSHRELVARLRAAVRNRATSALNRDRRYYVFGPYRLDVRLRVLTHLAQREIRLTTVEFNLLTVLLANPQVILTRERLLSASRLHEGEITDRSLDGIILRLRRKIEFDAAGVRFIKTVRGYGYLFDGEVQAE